MSGFSLQLRSELDALRHSNLILEEELCNNQIRSMEQDLTELQNQYSQIMVEIHTYPTGEEPEALKSQKTEINQKMIELCVLKNKVYRRLDVLSIVLPLMAVGADKIKKPLFDDQELNTFPPGWKNKSLY